MTPTIMMFFRMFKYLFHFSLSVCFILISLLPFISSCSISLFYNITSSHCFLDYFFFQAKGYSFEGPFEVLTVTDKLTLPQLCSRIFWSYPFESFHHPVSFFFPSMCLPLSLRLHTSYSFSPFRLFLSVSPFHKLPHLAPAFSQFRISRDTDFLWNSRIRFTFHGDNYRRNAETFFYQSYHLLTFVIWCEKMIRERRWWWWSLQLISESLVFISVFLGKTSLAVSYSYFSVIKTFRFLIKSGTRFWERILKTTAAAVRLYFPSKNINFLSVISSSSSCCCSYHFDAITVKPLIFVVLLPVSIFKTALDLQHHLPSFSTQTSKMWIVFKTKLEICIQRHFACFIFLVFDKFQVGIRFRTRDFHVAFVFGIVIPMKLTRSFLSDTYEYRVRFPPSGTKSFLLIGIETHVFW